MKTFNLILVTLLITSANAYGSDNTTTGYIYVGGPPINSYIVGSSTKEWFKVDLIAGTAYHMVAQAYENVGLTTYEVDLDTVAYLFDSTGKEIMANDDPYLPKYLAGIDYTPTISGTYYFGVKLYREVSSGFVISVVKSSPSCSTSCTSK